ncbi:hypothetical protein Z969_10785, partial [Clostridium novyi A str. 4570]
MISQDYLEVLRKFKEDNYEEELNIDTMKEIENINPNISNDSISYREGNKYIFKQPISYENAENLINILSTANKYNENNISIFKDEIRKKCSLITTLGESPTEMLIYGTKLFNENEIYINCILDELKNLKDTDNNFKQAYKNILVNWTWNKQLSICMKSISIMYMTEFGEQIYEIFKNNSSLRKDAAIALIDLKCRDFYNGMINLLIALLKDTENRAVKDMIREIFFHLGKSDSEGSAYLYVQYLKNDYLSNEARNIITSGIRPGITPAIVKDIEKRLKDKNISNHEQIKLIRLLGRIKNKDQSIKKLLMEIKSLSHINKIEVINAIGEDSEDLELLINNKNTSIKQKIDAIIILGKSDSKESEEKLRNIKTNDNQLKIAIHSALFEKGNQNEIVHIFKYLIDNNISEEDQNEAKNQIKRLRGLRQEKLTNTLLTVVKKLLEADKNKRIVLTILDLYSSGIADESVGEVFLKKLKATEINEAKI